MAGDAQTPFRWAWTVLQFAWAIVVILGCTAIGATIGWQKYGLVGALALAFVGFFAGVFLANPMFVLQLLT